LCLQPEVFQENLDVPRNSWTSEQLDFLRQNYVTATPDALVAACGHTWPAVKVKACNLGLNRHSRPIDRDVLVADYQAGMSWSDLTRKHRVSPTTLYNHLDAAGVPRRNQVLGEIDPAVFASDWSALLSADLTRKYGVCLPVLRQRAKDLGLPPRKGGRRFRLTPEQQDEAAAAFQAGATIHTVAVRYGVSDSVVGSLLRHRGIVPDRLIAVQKAQVTSQARYGVDNPAQAEEVKQRARQTSQARYGVEHPLQNPEVLAKVAATNQERYGSPSPFGSPEVQAKTQATFLERYGTLGPPNCYGKTQAEIQAWLATLGLDFQPDRTVLGGREIDLYHPGLRLGIEYCGLHWHHERSPQPRGPGYHAAKHRECLARGVRLITIFEDEWLHREAQVKNFLRSATGRNPVRLHARKCRVATLDKAEAVDFCERHHIQGAALLGRHFAGLLDLEGRLVGAMSLGGHHRGGDELVLDRLCFADGVAVAGGASRLLGHLVRVAGAATLISWSDNRWSAGAVYRAMGFTLEADLPADYSYVDDSQAGVRLSKQSQRKSACGCPDGLTEKAWAEQRGLFRLWDCGKQRWRWTAGPVRAGQAGGSLPCCPET
jgi:hypothetical protein